MICFVVVQVAVSAVYPDKLLALFLLLYSTTWNQWRGEDGVEGRRGHCIGKTSTYVVIWYPTTEGSYIVSTGTVHAGCVFIAGTGPSRTWTPGSLESMSLECLCKLSKLHMMHDHKKSRVRGPGCRESSSWSCPLPKGQLRLAVTDTEKVEWNWIRDSYWHFISSI